MSVTIKKGVMKYKNPQTGEYTEFNAIAEATTANQIDAIETAGTAQIAAVEAKGVEVRGSIPNSYTTLSNNVDTLMTDMSEIKPTVAQNTTDVGELKSVLNDQRQTYNWLPQNNYFSQVQKGDPCTINGRTFKIQPNGEILVTGVTGTGGATYYVSGTGQLSGWDGFVIPAGTYRFYTKEDISAYASVGVRFAGDTSWQFYFSQAGNVQTFATDTAVTIGIEIKAAKVLPETGLLVQLMVVKTDEDYGYIAPWASLANYVPQIIDDITTAKANITELQDVEDAAFKFRGYLDALNITALTSCIDPGWYSCGTSYVEDVVDLPADFGTDNITALFVYGPAAANTSNYFIYQELVSGKQIKWHRLIRKSGAVYSDWTREEGEIQKTLDLHDETLFNPLTLYESITSGKYWDTTGTAAYLDTHSDWAIIGPETGIDVKEGDVFRITASQGATNNTRIWAVTDDNYNIIALSPDFYDSSTTKHESYCVVPRNGTKLLVSFRNVFVAEPRCVIEQLNRNFDPVRNVRVAVTLVSGGVNDIGKAATDNTRIRVQGSTMPRMKTGDYIQIREPYEARVLAYSIPRYSFTTDVSLVESLTGDDYISGTVYIPAEYNGLYFACIIRNKTTPSADISGEVTTVGGYVDFVSVQTPTEYAKRNVLHGLKLSVMGDSISAMQGYIPEGNAAYYNGSNHEVYSVHQMWWKALCDLTGMTPLVINAWSGSGVTQLEDSAHSSITPMSSDVRCANLGTTGNDPDIIIIAGGTNDYSYAQSAQSEPLEWDGKTAPVLGDSFTEAYACMIKKIQTNYPTAIIVACSTWFTMRGTDNGYTLTHTSGSNVYTQADYDEAIESVCRKMHIPFVDVSNIGFNRSNYYPTYASDSETEPTHMNYRGQIVAGTAIAEKIVEAVKGFFA